MKILYIITKSNWGGAQKYVYDLATNLKNENDIVVAFGGNGILADKLKENNIKAIHIDNLDRNVNILKELKVFFNLYKLYKKENPDIVHLNSSKIGAIGSLVARIAGIKKIIFTAHGFPFREERPFWQILIIKFISWLSIIFSHNTICVSRKDFEDVKNWLFVKNKIIVIHNGIKITDFENKKNYINNNFFKIISIGELHKNKGFIYGLKVIQKLKEKYSNFHYTILSFGGEEKDNLINFIKEKELQNFVDLIISNDNHKEKLKDFDIYFMPSIKEGLPYVLLEAGDSFLPIIASDTGGINEIIENNKNGYLIKPKNISDFVFAFDKILNNGSIIKEMADYSKNKIKNEFNIEKMINSTKNLYF